MQVKLVPISVTIFSFPFKTLDKLFMNLKEFIELHSKYKLTKEKFENLTIESEKEQNIKELTRRMTGWQLETFKESYSNKLRTGLSLFKQSLMKDKKI